MTTQAPKDRAVLSPGTLTRALILAPLGASLVPLFVLSLVLVSQYGAPSFSTGHFFTVWLLVYPTLQVTALTIGLGFHCIAFSRHWRRSGGYVLGGMAIATLFTVGLSLLFTIMGGPDRNLSTQMASVFAVSIYSFPTGVVAGWLFWLVRRPDMDNPDLQAVFE
jgi:hypothetical protein